MEYTWLCSFMGRYVDFWTVTDEGGQTGIFHLLLVVIAQDWANQGSELIEEIYTVCIDVMSCWAS